MTRSFPLYLIVLLPLVVGWFLVLWPGRIRRGAAAVAAFVAQTASLGFVTWAFVKELMPLLGLWHKMPLAVRGPVPSHPMLLSRLGTWLTLGHLQVKAWFRLDGLGALAVALAGLAGLVGLLIAWAGSIRVWKDRDWARHVGAALVTVGSVQALLMAGDFLWALLWWVATTQSAVLLAATAPGGDAPQRARSAWLSALSVDALFLLAVLVFLLFSGTTDLTRLDFAGRIMVRPRLRWVFHLKPGFVATLLLGAAALGRAGQFPLHRWFVKASRTSSVSLAVFLGAVAPSGFFFLASMNRVISLSPVALAVISAAGILSALLLGLSSTTHPHMGKTVSYLVVGSLGLAFGGFGLGGFQVGVLHATVVVLAGLGLASATASVSLATDGVMDLRDLGGLAAKKPWVAAGALVAVLTLVGFYPLGGWYSLTGIEQTLLTSQFPRTPGLMRLKPEPALVWSWASYLVALLAGAVVAYSAVRLWMSVFAGKKTVQKVGSVSPSLQTTLLLVAVLGGGLGLLLLGKNHWAWLMEPNLWGQSRWIIRKGWGVATQGGHFALTSEKKWLIQGIWGVVVLGGMALAAGLFAKGRSRVAALIASSRGSRWFYRWLNGDLGFGLLGRVGRWSVNVVAWVERGVGERFLADWVLARLPAALVSAIGWFARGMDRWGRRAVLATVTLGVAVGLWLVADGNVQSKQTKPTVRPHGTSSPPVRPVVRVKPASRAQPRPARAVEGRVPARVVVSRPAVTARPASRAQPRPARAVEGRARASDSARPAARTRPGAMGAREVAP